MLVQGVSVASKLFPRKIQAAALSKLRPSQPNSLSSYIRRQHGSRLHCYQASSLWLPRPALLSSLR